jgi:hypothetical protein
LGQETWAMDIRPVEICPLVWVQIWEFWFQPPCLCETQSRWMDDLCMLFPMWSMEEVLRCLAGDTVSELFRIQGTLNQHGYQSILQWYAIPSGLHLVGLSIVFQPDTDPTHTSRLCNGYLTKRESDGVLHQMTWPQSHDLNPIEMVWDELDRRVKEKQPTSALHMWELLQDCC